MRIIASNTEGQRYTPIVVLLYHIFRGYVFRAKALEDD
jgi:hypothetical protein